MDLAEYLLSHGQLQVSFIGSPIIGGSMVNTMSLTGGRFIDKMGI
jgi:hypothetical protein